VKGVGGAAKAFGAQALKRVPIVGSLLAGGVTLAMGGSAQEAVGSAVGTGVGTAIGATLGSFIPIPVVGTLLGGAIGGFIGDSIGSAIGGLFSPQEANAASLASAAASLSSMTRPSIEVKVIHDQDAIDKIDVQLGKRWRDTGRIAF
jgi:phage tail tape-measure protein